MKQNNKVFQVFIRIAGRVVVRYAVIIDGQLRLYASSVCAEVAK